MNSSDRLLSLANPVAVALLAVLVQLPVFDRTLSLLDEGSMLQFADLVGRGGALYRDAELALLPGAHYLLAACFDAFGASIRVARWLVVFEFAALAVLVFVLMRRVLSTRWGWRSVGILIVYRFWAFPHWTLYSYTTAALTLLAVALVALVRFLDTGGRWPLAVAGLATGLGLLCRQDYGAAVWLAANIVLVIALRVRATAPAGPGAVLAGFNAPLGAVCALAAAHFLEQGLLGEVVQQTLLRPLAGIGSTASASLPPLLPLSEPLEMLRTPSGIATYAPSILFSVDWKLWRSSAFYAGVGWDHAVRLFFYAPYLIVAAGAARLGWTRAALADPALRPAWLRELALLAFAASLVLAPAGPGDYVHVAVVYWPLLLLLVVYAEALTRRRRRLAAVLGVGSVLPALVVGLYTARLAWGLFDDFDTPLRGERAGIRVRSEAEAVIGGVVDYVRSHSRPGERVAVLPYFPLISFLAERDAPHPAAYTFWPVAGDLDRERRVLQALEASEVDFLVYHFTQWPQLPEMHEYAPELFAWLVRDYEMETIFSESTWGYRLAVLRRTAEVEAGTPLRVPHTLWPFRPVLAVRPLAGEQSGVRTLPVDVPAGDVRLRTAIGVHPSVWFHYPPSEVRFELRVVDGDDSQTLVAETRDPHRDPAQRGWRDLELSLAPWAGRRVQIELQTRVPSAHAELPEMGGWELPRLYVSARGADGSKGQPKAGRAGRRALPADDSRDLD